MQLSSAEIGQLAVGDVLNLGHRTSKPLSITSATSTFAIAVPGASGKQLAALIVEPDDLFVLTADPPAHRCPSDPRTHLMSFSASP